MATNLTKSSVSKVRVPKGKEGVTWDEATFTWDEGINSTWDSVGAIVTDNLAKSSITKTAVTKSPSAT